MFFRQFLLVVLVLYVGALKPYAQQQAAVKNKKKATRYFQRLFADSSFIALKSSLGNALRNNDKQSASLCLKQLGHICYQLGHYPQALDYHLQANKLFSEQRQLLLQAENLNDIGMLYLNNRQPDLARQHYNEAFAIYQASRNGSGIARTYGKIGHLHVKQRNYDSAFYYQRMALSQFQRLNDWAGLAKIYGELGIIYEDLKIYDSAWHYIGDALKRVPGIYVQLDQGEASLVSVRGTDPSKSTININGTNMSGTGDNRSVGINAVPSHMVQMVEVTKAITPDMDGDAIGGVINLVTRKAPYKKMLSVTAGTGYSFMIQKPMVNGNIVFGDRYFKDKKLGVMVSASYYRQFLGSNIHSSDWSDTKWVDGNTYFMPKYLSMEQIFLERIRQSYTIGLDYKFNEKHIITLTGIYNDYKDWRERYTLKVDDIGAEYPTNWKRATGYERTTAKGKKVKDANKDLKDDATGEYYVDLTNDHLHPQFDPETMLLYWGVGNAEQLAKELRLALNQQGIGLRGKKVAKKLTIKHGLKQALTKNLTLTNLEHFNEKEVNRYMIYQAISRKLTQ